MNTKDSNSLSSKSNEANSTQSSSERRVSLNLSRFNARINSSKEEASVPNSAPSLDAQQLDKVNSVQSTARDPHSSAAAPKKILSLYHHNQATSLDTSAATDLESATKTHTSAQQDNASKATISSKAVASNTSVAATSNANNQKPATKLDTAAPSQLIATNATAQTQDEVISQSVKDTATKSSSDSQTEQSQTKSAEKSTLTINQDANDANPSDKVSTPTVKDNKGKKTPPWMAQYQKENAVADEQQNKAASQQDAKSKQGKSNLLPFNKSAALEKEGNSNAAVYHPNNFFSLDFLSFQRSFDAIDAYLDQLLDNNQELLNLEIANGKVAKYEALNLEKEFVNNFTSKKNKASYKDQEQQVKDAISNYLRFKYRGVFKSVCLYNIFCEQLRLKMFEQLRQQCLNYSNLNMGNVSNELQSFLDLIEPVEVAANKLMRLTMIEDKLKLGYLYDFNISLKSYIDSTRESSSLSDEHVAANTKELQSIVSEKLPNIVNAVSFWAFVDDDGQQAANINHSASDEANQPKLDVDKSGSDNQAAHCPFSNKILSDHEFLEFMSKFNHKPSYAIQCENAALLNSILFTFDGFIPSEREAHVFDDCAFNSGISWINELYNPHDDFDVSNRGSAFFARMKMFAQSRDDQHSLFAFADADQCVQKDRLYINNCLNGNFTRNLSQMKLISRQISLLRIGMAVHCNCVDSDSIPYNFECAGAIANNDFASVVRFILDLNQSERYICKEMFNQISTPLLTISASKLADQVNKSRGFKDSVSQISDLQVMSFCEKLRNSVLIELLSMHKPTEDERINYTVEAHILPVLYDNLNNAQRVLNMINTVASLDHRMNQELHYLSPTLSKIFECSDTMSSNSQNCDEYNSRLQKALSEEALFTLVRNRLLKKYPKLSGRTLTVEDFKKVIATLDPQTQKLLQQVNFYGNEGFSIFALISSNLYPNWNSLASYRDTSEYSESSDEDDDEPDFSKFLQDEFMDSDDLSELSDFAHEDLLRLLAHKLAEYISNS